MCIKSKWKKRMDCSRSLQIVLYTNLANISGIIFWLSKDFLTWFIKKGGFNWSQESNKCKRLLFFWMTTCVILLHSIKETKETNAIISSLRIYLFSWSIIDTISTTHYVLERCYNHVLFWFTRWIRDRPTWPILLVESPLWHCVNCSTGINPAINRLHSDDCVALDFQPIQNLTRTQACPVMSV